MSVPTVADKRRLLKIKLKSLAIEAKIIRQEEDRLKGTQKLHLQDLRREMAEHRRGVVRNESRHTGLAYAFIRGKGYREVEPRGVVQALNEDGKPSGPVFVDAEKIRGMVLKYGSQKVPPDFIKQWLDAPMRDKPPRKPKKPYVPPDLEVGGRMSLKEAIDAVQPTA